MATSLLIPAQQSTSNSGGVFAEHPTHSPPAASTAESSVVDRATDATVGQLAASGSVGERRKKKPYKELTLEEKVQLIRLAEENAGMSQASIAERYSIAKSNVCRILQRKQEYLRAYESAGFAGSRKRKLRGDPETQTNSLQNPAVSTNNCATPIHLPIVSVQNSTYYDAASSQFNAKREHDEVLPNAILPTPPVDHRFGQFVSGNSKSKHRRVALTIFFPLLFNQDVDLRSVTIFEQKQLFNLAEGSPRMKLFQNRRFFTFGEKKK